MIRERTTLGIVLLLALITAVCAVSWQSLWIDEAHSAMKALALTWSDFIFRMAVERGSDLQMPGYMVVLWIWEKIFGSSEYALRALNIPLFIGALAFVGARLRTSQRTRIFFILFACTSAFLWEYLNEARPYMMQFFGATLAMTGLYNMVLTEKGRLATADAVCALLGLLVLLASSLSTIFFVALLGVVFLVTLFQISLPSAIFRNKAVIGTFLVVGMVGLLLGDYFYWTLKVGARASGVGKTNLISTIFCFYELAGFSGLGPGRSALRDNPMGSLRHFAIPLATYGVFLMTFIGLGIASCRDKMRNISGKVWLLIFAVMGATLMMIALGVHSEFRVLGRHLMPAFPFLILGSSWGADILLKKINKLGFVVLALVLAAGLASSLEIRFAARHAKDDYRSAAAIAEKALKGGQVVWWAADEAGAAYYRLVTYDPVPRETGVGEKITPTSLATSEKSAIVTISPSTQLLSSLPMPTMIILSKTDIYDSGGTLREWILGSGFVPTMTFPAFRIYSKL